MGLFEQLQAYIDANTPRSTRPVANPSTVINQGLLNPNKFNAPAANRLKDSAFGLLGVVPGVGDVASAAESADLFNRGEKFAGSVAALGALPLVPALGGMFIGKGAKTWDVLKAQQAEELLKQGIDPREVWKQTGTLKGVDGALRQEIPDNAASFNKDGIKKIYEYGYRPQEQVFRHDELYAAYPELGKVSTTTTHTSGIAGDVGQYGGAFDGDNMISLGVPRTKADIGKANSVNVHELQHAIQQREGWARGGSPESIGMTAADEQAISQAMPRIIASLDEQKRNIDSMYQKFFAGDKSTPLKSIEDMERAWNRAKLGINNYEQTGTVDSELANNLYRRLAGEAEARLTQSRMGLDAAQRLEHYPYDQGPYGIDVPLDSLIVRGLLDGPAMSVADDAGGLLGKSAGSSPNFDAWNVKTGAQQTLDGGSIRVPFVDDAGEEYGSLVYRETPNEIIIDGLGRNRSDRTNKGAPSRAVKAVIEKALAEGKTVRATSGGFAKNYWGGPMGFKVDQATDPISPDYIFDAEQAAKVLSGDVNSTIWGHERGYGAMFEDMYGRSLKK